MIVNTDNAEHYTWGNDCDGWHLLNNDNLSVIQERMPPGTAEVYHYHNNAQQVFYILQGEAVFTIDEKEMIAAKGDSLHVSPHIVHKIENRSADELLFLVISNPRSHGDRVIVE